jgi:hypothetical protein
MKRIWVTIVLLLAVLAPGASAPAETASRWAPAATAKIHPGVQMFTSGAQCTANFVFTDALHRVYVGYAAHCAGLGEANDSNGCTTKTLPLGTPVRFATGADQLVSGTTVGYGKLAYSSWRTMQRLKVRNADLCNYNDLALVRLNSTGAKEVNPSVPFYGGPTALGPSTPAAAGDRVYTYGASSLRPGVELLKPKSGLVLGSSAHGWTSDVYTLTPGIPGDSGSGFLDAQGRATGVLSTIAFTPLAGSNGVGNLYRELRYAQLHSGIAGLRLVPGTEKFSPTL